MKFCYLKGLFVEILILGICDLSARAHDNFPSRLKISAFEPPIYETKTVKPFYNSYVSYEILKLLVERLHFSYELIPPSDMLYGSLVNGNWTGMVGQVYREEVDLGAQSISVNYARYQAVEATYPFLFDTSGIMIPVPQEDDGLLAPLQPFSYQVWICLILAMVALTLGSKGLLRRATITDHALSILSLFTGQSFCYISSARKASIRLLIGSGCLAAVIISNSYTTVVFSVLTIPKYFPVINSLEDLQSSEILPSTARGTIYELYFADAKDGLFKKIGDRIRQHPEAILKKIPDGRDPTADGKLAYILAGRYLDSLIYEDFRQYGYCRLTKARKGFDPINFSFILKKKSPLITPINRQIMLMHEHGLVQYFEIHVKMRSPCSDPTHLFNRKPDVKQIPLKRLGSIFIFYIVGVIAAFAVFLAEKNARPRSSKQIKF